MGTASTTARSVVDDLRSEGKKVGLAKLRVFRPFPTEALRSLAKDVNRIGVADRSFTFGAAGAAMTEVAAALYDAPSRPTLSGFLAGIGGRDVTPSSIRRMFADLLSGEPPTTHWVDLEEQEMSSHG
jgi:pyruvate/2-oxoacid:ferredoxin oxidoreductase alpha subunit